MIDYKQLLINYMAHVLAVEGYSFVDGGSQCPLSEQDINDLDDILVLANIKAERK